MITTLSPSITKLTTTTNDNYNQNPTNQSNHKLINKLINNNTAQFNFPITIIQNPNMPAASKIIERPFTWEEITTIIDNNKLQFFARSGEETEKYHNFKHSLNQKKTTIFKHLLVNELHWFNPQDNNGINDISLIDDCNLKVVSHSPTNKIFTNGDDLKILRNNFPYYFEPTVKHYCIWSKIPIPSDVNNELGDMSPTTKKIIESYVVKTFVQGFGISRNDLVWFRNWGALQSVKSISHIHVIINGVTLEQEQQFLNGCGLPLTEDEYDEIVNEEYK